MENHISLEMITTHITNKCILQFFFKYVFFVLQCRKWEWTVERSGSRNSRGQQTAEGPSATAGVPLSITDWKICQAGGGVLLWQRRGAAVF